MTTPDPAAPVAATDVVEPLACAGGCGLLYSDPGWVDVCIPVSTWAKIAPRPDGGGVLCLTCITRRLKAAGIHDVPLLVCDPRTYRHGPYDDRDAEIARLRAEVDEAYAHGVTAGASDERKRLEPVIDALRAEVAELRALVAAVDEWRGSIVFVEKDGTFRTASWQDI